jgi:acyl-homoserine lactone synthase
MIDCVSIATSHNFPENLLAAQHRLRYREVIQKENWSDVYITDGMEFDCYDNLATEYYVARDKDNRIVGVTRSYPTTIPYMLSDAFTFLFSQSLPSSPRILEASRLVLDRSLLNKAQRRPVVDKLVVSYMERGLQRGVDAYVGFMLVKIWASTFQRAGWDIQWLGPEIKLPKSGDIVRAGLMPVNEQMNRKVRMTTGIQKDILNFGCGQSRSIPSVVMYSHLQKQERMLAA